ncbi:ABC transporter substrate-binding protein [Maridesulfovibrio frigidus]|uniref:ABC transporter substrate-binding protein n=1 Tax=Maridesulfovibrio frigidus TaxID=340956 RepID=UPI00054E82D1|nr:sugar ABC transporter ATPase [Maridesulfovibrio frigidus]
MYYVISRVAILVALITLFLPVCANAKPKVLVIESYHAEYEWNKNNEKGLESVLKGKVDLSYFRMDTKRVVADQYQERADLAWDEYIKSQPDVVVLADDNALKLLGPKFLKTDTPVVYLGINGNPRRYIELNKNITGVLERPLYKRSVKYLKQILNLDKSKILILLDTGTTAKVLMDSVFDGMYSAKIGDIQITIQEVATFEDWKNIINKSADDGYSAIILGLFQTVVDDNNDHVKSDDILKWTSKNSPVPIFGFWEMNVGKDKTIGGLVLSGEVQGITAGEIVLSILNGVPVQQIKPVIPSRGLFVFSKTELFKWKISLPRYVKGITKFIE